VTFFLALFPGSELGLEGAAVFAVFTSQAWNITFSFYHSLITQPGELDEASRRPRSLVLDALRRSSWPGLAGRRRMILPAVFPAYVTGAITAAGGAWNASIVAEIVIYNRHVLVASGLGSYITQATARNDFHQIIAGILVMAVYVTGLNALLWRRLYSLAESKYALA